MILNFDFDLHLLCGLEVMGDRADVLFQAFGCDAINGEDGAAEEADDRVLPWSLTGKMNAVEPGVCPGIATTVTVTSPSFTGWPSLRTISSSGGPAGFC